jgi:hypothetical protein
MLNSNPLTSLCVSDGCEEGNSKEYQDMNMNVN